MNTCVVLSILAVIGADDKLIFVDSYHESAQEGYLDLETWMNVVFVHTGTAIGITSAITCISFFALSCQIH